MSEPCLYSTYTCPNCDDIPTHARSCPSPQRNFDEEIDETKFPPGSLTELPQTDYRAGYLRHLLPGLLNDMLECDPVATHQLIANAVPCNQALADHPTIVVRGPLRYEKRDGDFFTVSALGLLNGIAAEEGGSLVAVFDDETRTIKRFEWKDKEKS